MCGAGQQLSSLVQDGSYNYAQVPSPVDASCYDDARGWVANFVSKIEDVIAVYEYGTVNNPGLSDLDLMIVVRDNPCADNLSKQLDMHDIPERFSSIVSSDSVKIGNHSHFKDICLLGEFRGKLIFGDDVALNEICARDSNLIKIASVMDFLPERVLTLAEYRFNKTIPIVEAIGMLRSYLYSAKIAEEVIGKQLEEIGDFEDDLTETRRTWFQKDWSTQAKRMIELINKGITSGIKTVDELAISLAVKGFYWSPETLDESLFFINDHKGFSFHEVDSPPDRENRVAFDPDGRLLFSVPSIWLQHLKFYAQCIGIVSSNIRNNLFTAQDKSRESNPIDQDLADLMSRKIDLCNRVASFFQTNGISMNRMHRFAHIRKLTGKSVPIS
jgi:hypothetical protein